MLTSVLGYGTVGQGVYEGLKEKGPVLVREGKANETFKRDNIQDIIAEKDIKAVVETIGGIDIPFSYAKKVILAKKHFVTSNKALVAEKGIELNKLAHQNSVGFLFSASCGGGIPYLYNLSRAVESGETIENLGGILNGTTNFMLDCIQRLDMTYDEALKKAQELGYAEADPTSDVSGLDALRKIVIAYAVAYNKLPIDGLLYSGIESFTKNDAIDLKKRGLVCRLVAYAEPNVCYVQPKLFKQTDIESTVLLNFNLCKYTGKNSGTISLIGQGAGRYPTASNVLRDVSSLDDGKRYMFKENLTETKIENNICKNYYIRTKSGVKILNNVPIKEIYDRKGKEEMFFAEID